MKVRVVGLFPTRLPATSARERSDGFRHSLYIKCVAPMLVRKPLQLVFIFANVLSTHRGPGATENFGVDAITAQKRHRVLRSFDEYGEIDNRRIDDPPAKLVQFIIASK